MCRKARNLKSFNEQKSGDSECMHRPPCDEKRLWRREGRDQVAREEPTPKSCEIISCHARPVGWFVLICKFPFYAPYAWYSNWFSLQVFVFNTGKLLGNTRGNCACQIVTSTTQYCDQYSSAQKCASFWTLQRYSVDVPVTAYLCNVKRSGLTTPLTF